MTLWIIILVIAAVLLVAVLAHVMHTPSKLGRWRSRPAAPGSTERHRVVPRSSRGRRRPID